jgi:UV DNA damage endonuclease
LVYDIHHHRCNPDGLSVAEATEISVKTWGARKQEPYFHISSPKFGWDGGNPKPHSDYIEINDFPKEWFKLDFTLDVEAKAKELAVLKLMGDFKDLK